ncbi:MAG: hypothetical protein CL769_01695 [Chloroflexi bacterium]|nr:hypothetical protein [Chloroflexota bacterium]|tara:strand:- start:83 stop:793 length:711 start_codon:yes stop_codon:yes gene_type:complete
MKEVYKVRGMTCEGCANSIKETLESNEFISSANISLQDENINIISDKNFTLIELNSLIDNLGEYKIYEEKLASKIIEYFSSKKTLLLALSLVLISSLSLQVEKDNFDLNEWMISYMGIFFLLFSFLKLIDVKGFSGSFKKYDLISKIIPSFAITYPFVELFLALAFLSGYLLFVSYIMTIIFMTSQFFGVFISLQKKEVIKCACMGSSISIDISTLTLIENLVMILMSSYMIIGLI